MIEACELGQKSILSYSKEELKEIADTSKLISVRKVRKAKKEQHEKPE